MEGVTDACFRDLVLERNAPEDLGGAFTEFARVVDHALPTRILRRHLGERRFRTPVGMQLMGHDLGALAATAARVVEAGAPILDLNFGCPAKGALRTCAGSALLRDPRGLEEVVRTCSDAVAGRIPVSAKIRAGYDDAETVEELARAAESGGAALLTIHCRTRKEHYQQEVDWSRVARAVAAVAIPVCGNGGVRGHADLARMRTETGCEYVMVGHAALANPWIFSGRTVTTTEAARFLTEYADAMQSMNGVHVRGAVSRIKQLLRHWTAGELIADEDDRHAWLREQDADALLARLHALQGAI